MARWTAIAIGGAAALIAPAGAAHAAEQATLTLQAPASVARAGSLVVTGTFSAGPASLTVTRKDLTGSHTLPAITADAGGAFTLRDKPMIGGTNTYTVVFAGDAGHDPTNQQVSVAVSRRATKVTITTDASTYRYAATAKITAKLGTTHDSRTLCVYAQPAGGDKKKIKCGSGTVTATYKPTRRTVLSASFAGDQWYAPLTASRTVKAGAKIEEVLVGQYATSGKYKLYRTSVDPALAVRVSPAHPGGCIGFTAEQYRSGKWRTLATAKCFRLDGDSIGGGTLLGSHSSGTTYRLRASFAGDSTSGAATGAWQYLKFTK
ncbi:hypothetical protein [Actinoplanes friuliensis]|uniref:Ig-like domain repeat protein n=1 Tax=Actinoplanes friuliensis DSM 7358 TaxID=1246995 RepID=U5VYR0_9ACTN|nr:hypothetical protein [Actinoplanes friuliensis]AGZ42029.1 hypothetical protein AFR_18765 [Actinoplanes friuliensis DSM 7358]